MGTLWTHRIQSGELGAGEIQDVQAQHAHVGKDVLVGCLGIGMGQEPSREGAACDGEVGAQTRKRHGNVGNVVGAAPGATGLLG